MTVSEEVEEMSVPELHRYSIDQISEKVSNCETSEVYESVHLVVHPGYADYRGSLEDDELLEQEEYFGYLAELFVELDRQSDTDQLLVAYPEDSYEDTFRLMQSWEQVNYLETTPSSSVPRPEHFDKWVENLSKFSPDAEITVSGELNGKCVDGMEMFLEDTGEELDGHGWKIKEGFLFPEGKIIELYGKRTVMDPDA